MGGSQGFGVIFAEMQLSKNKTKGCIPYVLGIDAGWQRRYGSVFTRKPVPEGNAIK